MRTLKTFYCQKNNNLRLDDATVIATERRVLDSVLLVAKVTPLGQNCFYMPNDISLFLSQQKLAQYNPSVVSAIVSEFKANSTSLSDSLAKYSDDQILNTVKSRYIQSTTDMSNYLESLTNITKNVISELSTPIQAQAAQEPIQTPT